MHNSLRPSYDVALMEEDLALLGWLPIDLARYADVSHMTVYRFLRRETQTPRTAKKLARALRKPVSRYLITATAPEGERRAGDRRRSGGNDDKEVVA